MKYAHVLLSVALLATSACARESAPMQGQSFATPSSEETKAEAFGSADVLPGNSDSDSALPTQRLVIRTGTLNLVSESPEKASKQIQARATALGGYVVEVSDSGSGDYRSIAIQSRIPAQNLDAVLEEFRGLGEVTHENISGQDVTEEFVDIQARMKVQKALEIRFMDLLTAAQSVEDTLRVEQELARVRSVIEQMEGRQKYLRDQANLATLTVNVSSKQVEVSRNEIARAFGDAGEIIETVIAGMIRVCAALLPIGLVGGIFTAGLVAVIRRRRNKKA